MPSARIHFDQDGGITGIDVQAASEQQEILIKQALGKKCLRRPLKVRLAGFLRDMLVEIGTRFRYRDWLSKAIDRLTVCAEDDHVR